MDYDKSVIQEKMQVWMKIIIKYFTLPVSTASSLDAKRNWNCYAPIQDIFRNCYAPIQDIFHKNPIYLKKLGSRNLSILAPKHHCRSVWPLNMIPCYFNQKMFMWTFYNCESVGNSRPIAIRKEWQNQISWQTGTFPFGD